MRRKSWFRYVLAACVLAGFTAASSGLAPAAAPAAKRDGSAQEELRVNINTATEVELTKLPGVGSALAKRIVEFREKNGPFRRVEDLMKVRGIGEKTFQKMRPHLTVGKQK